MYFCYQKLQKHHSPVSQKSSMDHFEAEYHFSMRISEDKLIFNQKFQNRCAHLPLVQGNSSFQTLTVEILKQSTKGAGFNKMWVVTFSRLQPGQSRIYQRKIFRCIHYYAYLLRWEKWKLADWSADRLEQTREKDSDVFITIHSYSDGGNDSQQTGVWTDQSRPEENIQMGNLSLGPF